MKTTFKTYFLLLSVLIVTAASAQNSAPGQWGGGGSKDSSTKSVYKDKPVDRYKASVETLSIKKTGRSADEVNAANQGGGAGGGGNSNGSGGAGGDMSGGAGDSAAMASDDGSASVDTSATAMTDDGKHCSCEGKKIAYGVAGISLLGFLIMLALYLSKKDRKEA